MKSATRNYGIDLLRIVSMLAIVTMHILGHGGAISTSDIPVNTFIATMLESLCSPAVNCFILVSGFVGFRNEHYFPKLRNLVKLFFQVVFYGFVINAVMKVLHPDQVGFSAVLGPFLPVSNDVYWFFTCYFAMFILSPLVNYFVHKADRNMIFMTVVVIFFFGIYEVFSDPFMFQRGFHFAWFVFMYTLGAIIKKLNIIEKASNRKCLICIGICTVITWLPRLIPAYFWVPVLNVAIYQKMLDSYCSPTVIFMAVSVICLFGKIKINPSSFATHIISFLSTAAFSVYLIHDNTLVRKFWIAGHFTFLTDSNPFLMVIEIILSAGAIYLVCTLIDYVRGLIFRLLKIEKLSEWIERLAKCFIAKITGRLQNMVE